CEPDEDVIRRFAGLPPKPSAPRESPYVPPMKAITVNRITGRIVGVTRYRPSPMLALPRGRQTRPRSSRTRRVLQARSSSSASRDGPADPEPDPDLAQPARGGSVGLEARS